LSLQTEADILGRKAGVLKETTDSHASKREVAQVAQDSPLLAELFEPPSTLLPSLKSWYPGRLPGKEEEHGSRQGANAGRLQACNCNRSIEGWQGGRWHEKVNASEEGIGWSPSTPVSHP
jgi:hypothetical protein